MSNNDSAVQIKIPEELVRGIIQGEIIKQMGDQEAMIRAVVQAAMDKKVDNYSRETLFQQEFRSQINDMAKAMLSAWIAQNKEKIRLALHAELERGKGKRLKEIAEKICANITSSAYVSFKFDLENGEGRECT